MSQRSRNALLEWKFTSSRLARIRLKGSLANVSVLSTYAPTHNVADASIEVCASIAARDYLIAAGDFSARVDPSDETTTQVLGSSDCNTDTKMSKDW
ncbi:hypothetical protein QYM36_004392 [Artemia franciscana]|uniref:Uncharacterized protein n=1 Tax=Artemia franciscana TaxID=6661 RepID=A0AA88HYJ7_ARTSF|nr:hypothetical protein QYM36_004392 [Artemia franciscana]